MKRLMVMALALILSEYAISQSPNTYTEQIIGHTYYDIQSWRAIQNQLYAFNDGTFGKVWTMADNTSGFPDVGIGYSYYDGNQWNNPSSIWQSITSVSAAFPSYTAFGENGELCFSQGENGLIMSSREEKGTGDWIENYMEGTNYRHPFVVTSPIDNSTIQLLCLDPDPNFQGSESQPELGSILYSRSTDGGNSWDPENSIIDGMGSDHYLGFTIGSYAWADPMGYTIAFVAGDYHTDLILMKSTDGGDNWQKTVIWEHPYPFFELGTFTSDSFYCNDGGISVALDSEGMAHVAFSLTRVYSSELQDSIWYDRNTDGVVYWNEDRPQFSSNINALNPYGHPDSELLEDYSLIGWSQDINGNGELEILDDFGTYPTPGFSTMCQIAFNDGMGIVVLWSSVTETYQTLTANFRHVWARTSSNDGDYWGNFYDLNENLIFIFSENVYPVLSKNFDDDYIYTSFMEDNVPGLTGPDPPYSENRVWFFPKYTGWDPVWVIANFEADTNTIHAGEIVQFTNLSGGNPPDLIAYEWEFEGGTPEFSTSINPQVHYYSEGTYDVKLTASIDIFASNTLILDDYITVLPVNSIQENDNLHVSLFPNPTSGDLRITNYSPINYTIRILDQSGRQMTDPIRIIGNESKNMNLRSYGRGIYFIEILSNEGVEVQKLLLK